MVWCDGYARGGTGVLVKPPWYGALDKQGGIHGVMDKPPWYGVLDKQGALVKPPWCGVLDKHGGVQGRWLNLHGMVCWISKEGYRDAG